MTKLSDEDVPAFNNLVRMEPAVFRGLLATLRPKSTNNKS